MGEVEGGELTPDELTTEMLRLSKLIDAALDYLKVVTQEYARAEDAYRVAHAEAFLKADGTGAHRKALADSVTSKQRQAAHLADGMRTAALEAIRSRRAQLSALQTIANGYKAEADFARTAPA